MNQALGFLNDIKCKRNFEILSSTSIEPTIDRICHGTPTMQDLLQILSIVAGANTIKYLLLQKIYDARKTVNQDSARGNHYLD